MHTAHVISILVVWLALVACRPIQPPAQVDPVQAKIENAMSAAPTAIGQDATILDWPADASGEFITLRTGGNGWTCFTDTASTPTDDPMCLDMGGMDWLEAYMTGSEPTVAGVGIAYMLQGASTASNSDPYAMAPAAGEDWIIDPASLMVFVPEKLDQSVYPVDPVPGGIYIMWPGTPYEHLMVPVADLAATAQR
jgi:hypothetical protein